MQWTFALATLTAILLAPAQASAADYGQFKITEAASLAMDSPEYTACMKSAAGVTVSMRNCGGTESASLQKRLATALQTTLARLPKPAAKLLELDQKRWTATGLKKCNKRSTMNKGGTLELLEMDSCGHEETKRRLAWIEQYK